MCIENRIAFVDDNIFLSIYEKNKKIKMALFTMDKMFYLKEILHTDDTKSLNQC